MELTIEHLSAYLPYKLQCVASGKLYGIDILKKEMDCYMLMNLINNDTTYKPVLRSISELTKEIEHNGEKFVPMIELLKIEMDLHFKNCSDFNIEYNVMFSWVKYNFNFEQYALFYDNSFISFKGANYNNGSILGYYPTLNQYSLIQKLLSWHFDIYRLIETGLAINYNEINK